MEPSLVVNLIDMTKNPEYKRATPHKCVISNGERDLVCHTIFVISASNYFEAQYAHSEELCEIEPGLKVPRIRVKFASNLLEEYLRFAYTDQMKITQQNAEEILEFASYLNSTDMLALVEKFLCDLADSLPETFEQLKDYFAIAENYLLEQFKQKLTTRITASSVHVV